jgi:hypothetical protein
MLQPIDEQKNPVPVLRLGATTLRTFTSTSAATGALVAAGAAAKVYTLHADQDVYVAVGGSAVAATANDFRLVAHTYVDVVVGPEAPYVAALRVSADGTLRLTERV